MTSSSRAKAIAPVIAAAMAFAGVACETQQTSTEGPLEASVRPPRPTAVQPSHLGERLEPVSATGQRMERRDLERLGADFGRQARDPVMIEVRLARPVDTTPRTSSPVIILNGRTLPDTMVALDRPDTLIAYLPDRTLLQDVNRVEAAWLGNEELTRSSRPLSLRRAELVR